MTEREKRGRIGGKTPNPYHEDKKYSEPTNCPRCHLVYQNGRWQSQEDASESENSASSHCPACKREIDRMPAGLLYLTGPFLEEHRNEILNIIANQSKAATAQRPLQRIMWMEETDGTTEIATTSSHLAQRLGKAIDDACKGTLTVKRADDAQLVRLYWERST